MVAGVQIHEIVDHALLGHDRHSTLILLSPSAHPHAEGRGEGRTDHEVRPEGELVLVLHLALVLPGPALRVRHVLAEAQGNPGVAAVLVTQPRECC